MECDVQFESCKLQVANRRHARWGTGVLGSLAVISSGALELWSSESSANAGQSRGGGVVPKVVGSAVLTSLSLPQRPEDITRNAWLPPVTYEDLLNLLSLWCLIYLLVMRSLVHHRSRPARLLVVAAGSFASTKNARFFSGHFRTTSEISNTA